MDVVCSGQLGVMRYVCHDTDYPNDLNFIHRVRPRAGKHSTGLCRAEREQGSYIRREHRPHRSRTVAQGECWRKKKKKTKLGDADWLLGIGHVEMAPSRGKPLKWSRLSVPSLPSVLHPPLTTAEAGVVFPSPFLLLSLDFRRQPWRTTPTASP